MLEMLLVALAPFPGLQESYIPEYYPDWNDPDTNDKGAHAKLHINHLLLAAAMIFRITLLVRFIVTFSRFKSAR